MMAFSSRAQRGRERVAQSEAGSVRPVPLKSVEGLVADGGCFFVLPCSAVSEVR